MDVASLRQCIDPLYMTESERVMGWGTVDVEEARSIARKDEKCILNFRTELHEGVSPPKVAAGAGAGEALPVVAGGAGLEGGGAAVGSTMQAEGEGAGGGQVRQAPEGLASMEEDEMEAPKEEGGMGF